VINNFGGFYSRELYFHELKRTGALIEAPCMNRSEYLTRVSGATVIMGFIHVQGLEEQALVYILENRKQLGDFADLADFIERNSPGIEQLNILIRIGAFRFSGRTKKELLWEANFLHKKNASSSSTGFLFREQPQHFQLPELVQHPLDDALDEIELLGFPLCNVFDLSKEDPGMFLSAQDIPQYVGKQVSVLGYLVSSKPVNTVTREIMHFHSFLDAEGGWLDCIFFPNISRYYPVTGKGFYAMTGKVVEEFGVYSIEVTENRKVGLKDRNSFPRTQGQQRLTVDV